MDRHAVGVGLGGDVVGFEVRGEHFSYVRVAFAAVYAFVRKFNGGELREVRN